ncbi:uncharacterized protein A1O9_09494 [Exophiala aquamarina CBS 119918]|uniref:Bromo domain-containing protein n=1 Tax=Exophiala aquamarina CBS 119918 TaxID=1182545 RepID=A0A072P4Z6_9EURO|nr:uncharacterized protein A1O9_09494 [Exophiala aquamarina CBS 119918]KEF54328.1 hypothetical protein A1O9_09494 [Exophiala aquamarina CBS 119918]
MSSKRRSGPAGLPEDFAATPDPKRRKRNDDTFFPDVETAETTTEEGLKLIAQLKKSQDKNGRNVAIHFIDLPSREEYPDYYQQTAMPLSLNMIELRLQKREYKNMEQLEADLKRMVQNAKDYNHNRSPIFEDAERIRKALSNYMPKHNPAYLRPEYRAYPTPIPQELADRVRESSHGSSEVLVQPEKIKLHFSRDGARRRSEARPSTPRDLQAEVKTQLVAFLDELSEQDDAINFEERVSRKDYPDYYKTISKPTSISDVRAMVQKDAIQDWDSLAREVRLIWDNAKQYNQEDSDIYAMAEKLESWSEPELQDRGAAPRRNLKLSLSQPTKPKALRLTMGSSTPTPTVLGGTIDSESLRRQREETGHALSRAQRANSRVHQANGSTPVPSSAAVSVRRSMSAITEPKDTVMSDANGRSTPQAEDAVLKASQTPGPAQLPTPVQESELQDPAAPLTNGVHNHEQPATSPKRQVADLSKQQSNNPFERRGRDPGKDLSTALIASVTWMTNPNSPSDPKWKLIRYASPARTQTSYLICLPMNHQYIRVIPHLTRELHSRRRHRLYVTVNGQTLEEPNSTSFDGAYDMQLKLGDNEIVVEVVADLKEGEKKEYAPPQLQLDYEKCSMLINLGLVPIDG